MKNSNKIIKMAVDTAMFGVGASMIGAASESFKGNPTGKALVGASGTIYAAKYLDSVSGKKSKVKML